MKRLAVFKKHSATDEMHATNTKNSILKLSHRAADLFTGTFFCFGGVASFLPFASFAQWKPSATGEIIKGTVGYLIVFCFASTLLLVGLRYLCGPEGVTIDANQKTVCAWRRNIWLKAKRRIFPFEQLKQIRIEPRKKTGVFSHGFYMYSVLAGIEPDEVELAYYSTVSKAITLAKKVASHSGLQFLE